MMSEFLIVFCLLILFPVAALIFIFILDKVVTLFFDTYDFLKNRNKSKFRKSVQSAVADLYLEVSTHDIRIKNLENNDKKKRVKK